ncbi:hypothetical protein C8R47DRAFT_1025580 [Mycena vitilis]|nr:hypothetical protein C8R47DRAFT_1025580 [Mycena vitilis]
MPPPTFSQLTALFFEMNLSISRRLGPRFGLPFLIIYQLWVVHAKCENPWSTNLVLLSPIPWRFFNPAPLPVTVDTTPEAFYKRHPNIRLLRHQILFQARDTQLRALYRLYDAICMADEVEMKHEAVYIYYRPSWRLSDWPDPRDPDPDRYAVLAAIMEELVRAVNYRLNRGFSRVTAEELRLKAKQRRARIPLPLERPPSWTSAVPPAREKLSLLTDIHKEIYGEDIPDPPVTAFHRRNILAIAGAIFFP